MSFASITGIQLCCGKTPTIKEPLFNKWQIAALVGDVALVIIFTVGSSLTFLAVVGIPLGPLGGIGALTLYGSLSLLGGAMLIATADLIVLMMLLAKRESQSQRLRGRPRADRQRSDSKNDQARLRQIESENNLLKDQLKGLQQQAWVPNQQTLPTQQQIQTKQQLDDALAEITTAHTQVGIEQNRLQRQLNEMNRGVTTHSIVDIDNQISGIVQTCQQKKGELIQLQQMLIETQNTSEQLDTESARLRNLALDLQSDIAGLQQKNKALHERGVRLQQLINKSKETLDRDMAHLEEKRKGLTDKKANIQQEVEQKAEKMRTEVAAIEKEIQEVEATIQRIAQKVSELNKREAERAKEKKQFEQECQETEGKIKEYEHKTSANQQKIAELKNRQTERKNESAQDFNSIFLTNSLKTQPLPATPVTPAVIPTVVAPSLTQQTPHPRALGPNPPLQIKQTLGTTPTKADATTLSVAAHPTLVPPPVNATQAPAERLISTFKTEADSARQKLLQQMSIGFEKWLKDHRTLAYRSHVNYVNKPDTNKKDRPATTIDKLTKQNKHAILDGTNAELNEDEGKFQVNIKVRPKNGSGTTPWDSKHYKEGNWLGSPDIGIAHSLGCRDSDEDAFFSGQITFNWKGRDYKAEMHFVCDGHGDSAKKGQFVTSMLPKLMSERLALVEALTEEKIADTLTSCIVDIDGFLKDKTRGQNNQPIGAGCLAGGTTITGAFSFQDKIYTYNVGDSRTVLCKKGKEGKMKTLQLTEDADAHNERFGKTLVKRSVEVSMSGGWATESKSSHKNLKYISGKLHWDVAQGNEKEDYQPVPSTTPLRAGVEKLAVARSIGDNLPGQPKLGYLIKVNDAQVNNDSPDKGQIFYATGNYLVIGCDGLWDVVGNDGLAAQMDKMIEAGFTPMEMSAALMEESLKFQSRGRHGFSDNVTIIVVKLP